MVEGGADGVVSLCWERVVREELLRDRGWVDGDFSWLWRRASGGGGGVFFRTGVDATGENGASSVRPCVPAGEPALGLVDMVGGGGNGLLRSDCVRAKRPGDRMAMGLGGGGVLTAGIDGAKSENETVCGALEVTSLPCRCLGGGGFFLFSGFRSSLIKLECSSSSDIDISYDERGDSGCVSCIGPKMD